MSMFKAGFARCDITPPLGTPISGYFMERFASGILDKLEANAVAVSDGERTAVIISADILNIQTPIMNKFIEKIASDNALPFESIYVACTHTHTGPKIGASQLYDDFLVSRLSDAAKLAIADMCPASVGIGRGEAKKVSFVRRYRMKDGKIRTNPGVGNPDIVNSIGLPDETVQVVRFVREGKDDILIINFQVHPDTIGGDFISADYPRFVRETVENALCGKVKTVYFNGTQGDTNHVNVYAVKGDLNGLNTDSFDDVARGYEHSQHMGRAIGAAALSVYAKCDPVEVDKVSFGRSVLKVPSNMPKAEDMPLAYEYAKLHNEGRDKDIPYKGMELVTVVAEALRMTKLEHGPEAFDLGLSAVAFGPVAFLGIPGEPFTQVGRLIKSGSPFEMTIPTCLTNGSEGYYPMQEAYDEGGYEARSSRFKAGIAERIAKGGVELLKSIY
ncbi:MAG: hypothetical protein GX633_07315 [Clostridiales bacterium]|nr:hypothetical protein [Clostridiales bacterium]